MSIQTKLTSGKSFMIDLNDQESGGDPFNAVRPLNDKPEEQIPPAAEEELEEEVEIDDESIEEVEESIDPDIEEESEESDENDEEDDNVYYYVAQQFKEDGFLPDDLEVSKTIDGLAISKAYKEKLRSDLEPVIRNEVHQELLNEGYSQHDLVIARAIRQGIDPRVLSAASMYEMYASIGEDADTNQKEDVIRQMYRTRGFNEDEIASLLSKTQGDGEEAQKVLKQKFNEARSYFSQKYNAFVEEENARAEESKKQASENLRKANELINQVISSREILGEKMTTAQAKEFEDAIRKENQVVEMNGQKYRATELQKFLYDFNSSDELKLLVFKLLKFRDQEKEQLKKEAEKTVESEFLKGYKQRIVKKKASKNEKLKSKMSEVKKTNNSYFIGFNQQ